MIFSRYYKASICFLVTLMIHNIKGCIDDSVKAIEERYWDK